MGDIDEFLEKAEAYGSVLGLSNIEKLMEELGQVQDKLRIIHVAGTNGKGSVCTMLASILQQAGYKTGKYTSPHVFRFEEKYQINGIEITKEEKVRVFSEIQEACERMTRRGIPHPTIFEIETAAAFLWFYQKRCQIVVLETGLGGALDATNIIRKPLCSVFTSISMDHAGILGDTLEKIASVKAGIIKRGCPVVAIMQKEEVLQVLKAACEQNNTDLVLADGVNAENVHMEQEHIVFDWENFKGIHLSMLGAYQIDNVACAIKTIYRLNGCGFAITDETIVTGLEKSYWPGRFEIILRTPLVVLDGAHNEGAALKLRETVERYFAYRSIIFVIGVLADKAHEKMLQCMLPLAAKVYTVTPGHPRAMDGSLLCREALKYHEDVTYMPDLRRAARAALIEAADGAETMILAFGSLSYLGEFKKAVQSEAQ